MEGTETGALHFDQANVVPVTSRSNELDDDINLAHCIIHEPAVDSGAEDIKQSFGWSVNLSGPIPSMLSGYLLVISYEFSCRPVRSLQI